MKPVWIMYYGLLPVTRFGYLVATGVGWFGVAVLGLVGLIFGFLPPLETLWQWDPFMGTQGITGLFYNYFWWFVVVCAMAQVVDIWITLGLIAKKEDEQKAELADAWQRRAEERPVAVESSDARIVSPMKDFHDDPGRQGFHKDRM
jgi:hypothetical protein